MTSETLQPPKALRWPPLESAALLVLVAVALTLVGYRAVLWSTTRLDDARYGRPRLTRVSAAVGHDDAPERPTLLLALNLNRRVAVLEIPGGDVSKTKTLTGPYLFGADEDTTPVLLRLVEANHDGRPDFVLSIKQEEVLYINEPAAFRLANDGERAAFAQQETR